MVEEVGDGPESLSLELSKGDALGSWIITGKLVGLRRGLGDDGEMMDGELFVP
jgi:hypothetical protein